MSERRESAPPPRPSQRPPSLRPSALPPRPSRPPRAHPRPAPADAADCLAAALRARSPASRAEWALRGLAAEDLESDVQVLLLRQLYLVHLEAETFDRALDLAHQMAAVGAMPDIAHHDRARVLSALGRHDEAILAQRQASRFAPPDRRSFHTFALGQLQHFAGDSERSLRTLERALRWSHADRPLIRGFMAMVELELERVPEALELTRLALAKSRAREGYGQFVLGMIAWNLGDRRQAAVHLRVFLRKNASIERGKAITLKRELERARRVLSEVEST